MSSSAGIDEVCVKSVVEKLKSSDDADNKTVLFIIEQLELMLKEPKGRRYSPSLLAMACLLHNTSPACYRQMLKDGVIALPSKRHLRRLTNAVTAELGLSESTITYLKARFSKLEEKDKVVGLLLDEVHCQKKVQYANGKFYGVENGEKTKSLLCIMVKSVAGRYQDVICMAPISNINAEKILSIWRNCLEAVTKIGFETVLTMTDGLEANVRFFKMVSGGDVMIKNPFNLYSFIFLLFDTVHLFKNIYNNLVMYGIFICSSFEKDGVYLTATFSHVVVLYNKELTVPVKRAYKLTEKVLKPSSLEKTSVMLADSCFHESTINALNYYASRGNPEFSETAAVFQIIRVWFNVMNVKSREIGKRKRDQRCASVDKNTIDDTTEYLKKFQTWLEKWRSSGKPGLSRQTFSALTHTVSGFIQIIGYLINVKGINYLLTGFLQSDPLEGRFRWYRQLCGANYFNSVLQFLQAEKTLRIRALVKDGFSMSSMKDMFSENVENTTQVLTKGAEYFSDLLCDCEFGNMEVNDEDKSIIYYYAGYISRTLLQRKTIVCPDCVKMISPGVISTCAEPAEEYTAAISRGGLLEPSNIVFVTATHAWIMWCFIRDNKDIKAELMKSDNQRNLFVESFVQKIDEFESTKCISDSTCSKGHPFRPFIKRIAIAMFNCFAVNVQNEANSVIHAEKKRKVGTEKSSNNRKLIKLTSGTSTAKIVEVSQKDCGECKFCKDKKKFGGKGTLKKRCEKNEMVRK